MSFSVTSSPYRQSSQSNRRRSHLNFSGRAGLAGRTGGVNAQVAALKLKFEFGPMTIIIGLMVVGVALILIYLAHFNRIATKGYDLKRLEAARQQLLGQYDMRNINLADAKAMPTILGSNKVSQMRRPGNVIFVRSDTAIASR